MTKSDSSSGGQVVPVRCGERSYSVVIGPGMTVELGRWLESKGDPGRAVVLADETVLTLHGTALEQSLGALPTIPVPPGERSKSLATAARVYDRLAALRVERGDVLITFGGGVVGDLGGFVAATWLRGIRFVQVPTTLLAAVDASVGGKTGVNHPAGKNLIGAFHQPSGVFVDVGYLGTLPGRDYAAGIAESVKQALIRAPEFVAWHEEHVDGLIRRDPDDLVELIRRNCAIKAGVVSADEREQGLRAILNYGHTIGHALETHLDYAWRHGECVGLGMLAENAIAVGRGWMRETDADRVRSLLAGLGLPVHLPFGVSEERIIGLCRLDKKVRGGSIHFVLLRGIGDPVRVSDVSDEEIGRALDAIRPRS